MPKHTPGPWFVEDGRIKAMPVYGVVNLADLRFGSKAASMLLSEEEHKANGKLMAAAPELLEALKGAIAWLDSLEGDMVSHWGTRGGQEEFIDQMPNGIVGRPGMRKLIKRIEKEASS